MRLATTTLVIAVLATAIHAQLLCYQCDDCSSSKPIVHPCGFVGPEKAYTLYPPLLTPPTGFPQYPLNPWDPQVNDRQLVRRGCTRLGPSPEETCNGVVGSSDDHCELCTSHLCNTGT
ncbi:uncharacterized protein LOC135696997 [Ochlerotatus camptorhynchus]|uniref:uncharacterized protein LOC135696997 n=1 Tax=Ochlerotatus camptorhynchus TaxID=644619 RepID=UPI0031D78CDD